MNHREEIERFSDEADKPALLWLLHKYHWELQWKFVARSSFQRIGKTINRVWKPTEEGRILYLHHRGVNRKVICEITDCKYNKDKECGRNIILIENDSVNSGYSPSYHVFPLCRAYYREEKKDENHCGSSL